MNYYWAHSVSKLFCQYYEFFIFFKINKWWEFKLIYPLLNVSVLVDLLHSCAILWNNVFKPSFWISRRRVKSIRPLTYPSYQNFIYRNSFFHFSNFFKSNFLTFFVFNRTASVVAELVLTFFKINSNLIFLRIKLLNIYRYAFGEGFSHIRGLLIIFFIDASFTDDEPLWEPVEWSLVQTWLVFIFTFAWIAENLITSRYGSYTGRDKRVWFGWYKAFWLIEFWYLLSFGAAAAFVMVPFYWELTYNISLVFSWWNWYTRLFFFKFISLYTIVLMLAFFMQISIRWFNWKKLILLVLIINFFLAYILYTHFIMSFFGYFTDPLWYQKTRFVDYIQLSHEPLKWGWGPNKRDHFTYHKTSTTFWFKNDGPFAGAFLILHLFLFVTIFFIYVYWLTLLRKVYATKEITYTFTTCCVSVLKQFFIFFVILYGFVFLSYIINYWRFPIEFFWLMNSPSWVFNFSIILKDYGYFLLTIF